MARLSNAKSFLALILLSQMEEQAEAPMRAISHLECLTPQPAGAPDAMVGHADVNLPLLSKLKKASGASAPLLHSPVSIRFISALRTGFYHPGDCPACGENSYYKDMAESAPTELLRQYAELRVQELSPSSRDVVMKRKCQFDLFGEPLSTRDIARCLQVRRLLEGSIRSTRLRFEVLEQLREIAGKPEMELAIPWFRLLSSEHTWTRLPPLAYDRTRKYLADICEEALLSTDTVSPGIRRQAAVVMRNVAPDTLSRQFGKLLQRNLNSRDVTGELLMSMVRILGNPRRFEDESVVDLDEGLRTMTDDILQGSLRAPMAENSYPTLSVISEALRQRRPLDREAQESRLEAWRALWACYAGPIKMHNLLARDVALGVAMALDAPSEPPGLPTSESWNHALSSWEQCRAFLYEEVIPHLRRLSSVLLNPLLQDRLLDQYRERLHRILRGPLEPAQGELTELLWKFRQDPNRFGDPLLRDRARNEWTFWYKSFFAPDPAAVLQAIQRCPADLWDLLHSSLAHVKQQSNLRRIGNCQGIENPALAAKVYCDKTLLLSALQQVLENALDPKHVDSECDVSEAVDIFIDCPESETNSSNEVVFRIWNTGTRPTEPSGNGLDKAAERLALFEGTLIPKAVYEQSEELPEGVPDAVTYMVTFRINKWENHD